ncbi:ATP synthase F1 subunit delta [Salegentibacter sp. F188]|uniref:ATP synthase subunit delta n=1 Tax=Autumnicola patrickiae TaxID=3075591 RepID=A0ABU3E101_9FLAO|nr:ATP synthase F1 subunit delta [Salegentibacter sp. F188]MDT0689643.1 ATP synthase F1 subunit delta [Salegentibacter sp. F188]
MKGTRAAQRYAKAIISLAGDNNVTKDVKNDMDTIVQTIAGSSDLKNMLKSPVIKDSVKRSALKEIFKDANGVTLGAFDILIENGRINNLDAVAKQYLKLYHNTSGLQEAIVTTAVPYSVELSGKIQDKIKELTGAGAIVKNVIDESMIGGFILRIGDLQYDASIARNLDNLKRKFKDNSYVSKI